MLPATLAWHGEGPCLRLLDQRLIPAVISFVDCRTFEEVAIAIENMTVRGAPAIGVAAAYGVALAANESPDLIPAAIERLSKTRPTAVNLFWALDRMERLYQKLNASGALAYVQIEAEAKKIHEEDVRINRAIGAYGQALLPMQATVITHCNAGALATAGYGTALGVFRAAREAGKTVKVYADETRPRLQGGKITSFELSQDGFDVTVISDSMAAFLMSRTQIDAVITGADRIAANGDTANKIGTYALAIAAKHHSVPFYIAAPISTIDKNCPDGKHIPIEERSGDEIRAIGGEVILPQGVNVWNPAFDVTPAGLIAGIITEAGVLVPPYGNQIKELLEGRA